jgi:hypothetical protein
VPELQWRVVDEPQVLQLEATSPLARLAEPDPLIGRQPLATVSAAAAVHRPQPRPQPQPSWLAADSAPPRAPQRAPPDIVQATATARPPSGGSAATRTTVGTRRTGGKAVWRRPAVPLDRELVL